MKVGKNKLLRKILLVTLTTLIVFNFIMPTVVRADDDDDIGGGLFTPIQDLLVGLGDSIMRLMQIAFIGNDKGTNGVTTTVTKTDATDVWWLPGDSEFDWENDVNWEIINNNTRKPKVKVPTIEISPESIFSGKIPAFDINFFTPQESVTYENGEWETQNRQEVCKSYKRKPTGGNEYWVEEEGYIKKSYAEILKEYNWKQDTSVDHIASAWKYTGSGQQDGDVQVTSTASGGGGSTKYTFKWIEKNQETEQQIYYVLEYELYGNKSETGERTTLYKSETVWVVDLDSSGTKTSIAGELRDTISYWYNMLRNIAIIGLLSVLVYIGIRIVLSSAAADKSKYKEMLKDWLVAICLLFFMHYFMNFTVTIIDSISSALVEDGNLVVTDSGITTKQYTEDTTNIPFVGDRLIGEVRIRLQTGDASQRMAYTIIYIVLIIYTFIFAIMYLKRVLYMAFFTMMAPLVALTYPLDKMRDGKAQAFDMWIKEYTFNALIQPFHLIIYYVLVSSAIDLASDNPMYALVAIGFMMPAEKLLRKFFGFNKSETSGALGGAFGGAMLMQGINALSKRGKGPGGKKGGSGGEGKEEAKKPVRTADSGKDMNELLDGIEGKKESLNPSDPNYSAEQEKLDKLEAEGFGEGDPEWDKAKADLDRHKIDVPAISTINDDDDDDDDNGDGDDDDGGVNEEKTHRLRAAATIGGKWLLKGAAGATKLAARGFGAATLGTVGIAAGLASDDYSNVLKYGAAGLTAGNAVAGAAINRTKKLPSDAYRVKQAAENVRRDYEEIAYSAKERKKRRNERLDDQFMKDKQAIQLYKDKFGKNYEKRMEEAKEYRAYGITDNDAIIKAMNLKIKGVHDDDKVNKKRILIAGTAHQLGRKDIDQFGERLMSRGHSKYSAEAMKEAIRKFNDFE